LTSRNRTAIKEPRWVGFVWDDEEIVEGFIFAELPFYLCSLHLGASQKNYLFKKVLIKNKPKFLK